MILAIVSLVILVVGLCCHIERLYTELYEERRINDALKELMLKRLEDDKA